MKQFFKELFCFHVDKLIEREYQYTYNDRTIKYYTTRSYKHLVKYRCIKCGRIKYNIKWYNKDTNCKYE